MEMEKSQEEDVSVDVIPYRNVDWGGTGSNQYHRGVQQKHRSDHEQMCPYSIFTSVTNPNSGIKGVQSRFNTKKSIL